MPRARGAAFRVVQEAEAYKKQVIAQAEGDTSRFLQVMNEYEKAPAITRERLYIESMESVYTQSQKVMIDVSKGSNNMLYLPLDKMRNTGAMQQDRINLGNAITYPSSNSSSSSSSQVPVDSRSRGGR